MYDTTIRRTSARSFRKAACFAGLRWSREDRLDWGLDFLLRREDTEEFRRYRERRLKELADAGVLFTNGVPLPGILFSAMTFPYSWSSSKKLKAAESVLAGVAESFGEKQAFTSLETDPVRGGGNVKLMSSGDVRNVSEQMTSMLKEVSSGGTLSGRTPQEDPWGCFSVWAQLSTDTTASPEDDKSVIQANFCFAEELSGFLDILWDNPEIRRERIWSVVEESIGRECVYLYSLCYCWTDSMWGVLARALSGAESV